jgi:starch synthase
MTKPSRINVLFMASEASPFIKVGGLADVAGSLPVALREIKSSTGPESNDLDVRLVIPFHPTIRSDLYSPHQVAEYPIHTTDGDVLARAFSLKTDGLPVYLIGGAPIDHESAVYSADLETDGYKYVFFSLACLELARKLNWKPNILHANDWHTATAVYSLGMHRPIDPFFNHTATLLTIHNLPYLGAMTSPALEAFKLPPADHSVLPSWAQHMALPLGLLAADSIVAVSPGYAKEILTKEFGSGLATFLKSRAKKITGILNGLDTRKWDPTADIELAGNYSSDTLQVRSVNKSFLQEEMGLEIDPHIPLLGMVTRMDPQKGVDLAVDALRLVLQSAANDVYPLHVVFLGTGDLVLESAVRHLEQEYPNQVRAQIMFDERLSHHIYAGADGLLMPSRYEPCGLSQMIAMHYGCVPIARATGGLSDTILDPSDTGMSTGFLFKPASPTALAHTIQRALMVYRQDSTEWQKIQIRGMRRDFSWDRSAQEYMKQYRILLGRRNYV